MASLRRSGWKAALERTAFYLFIYFWRKGFDDECHHHGHSSVPQIKTVPRLEDQRGTLKTIWLPPVDL